MPTPYRPLCACATTGHAGARAGLQQVAEARAQRPLRGPVVTEEVEAAELSALQEDLDRRRRLLRREREAEWRQRSRPEITRVMHAKLRAAADGAATRRFKALKSRKEAAALAALYPDRFVAAASGSSGSPPTVKKKRTAGADKADKEGGGAAPPGRHAQGEKEVEIEAYVESSGVYGHAAPRTAAAPGHSQQALLLNAAQMHVPPLTGACTRVPGAPAAVGAAVASTWAKRSLAWRRRQCAEPPAHVETRTLLAGMRVRAFYRRGGTKSQSTDAGVITRAPDGGAGRGRAGGGGRVSPGGLRTSRSLSPIRTHRTLGGRSPSSRNSVSPGRVRRGCVEVLFDDGAVQDVPVGWATPLSLVPHDGVCRVVCMYVRMHASMYGCLYVCMYRQIDRQAPA